MIPDRTRIRIHDGRDAPPGQLIRHLVLFVSRGRAVTLGNHIFLPHPCQHDVALLAHELVHCTQYQTWGAWRYFTRGAAAQLRELLHRTTGIGTSPYAYTLESGKPFDAYGIEQQARIVEDRVRHGLPTNHA